MNLVIILSILLTFSAVCYMLLGIRLVGGKREIGSIPLAAMFFIIGFWILGGALEMVADNYVVFSIGRVGHFIGSALVPCGFADLFSGIHRQFDVRDDRCRIADRTDLVDRDRVDQLLARIHVVLARSQRRRPVSDPTERLGTLVPFPSCTLCICCGGRGHSHFVAA